MLGFDIDSAKQVVKNILTDGQEPNKLKAADMIFKVEGAYAPEKTISVTATVALDATSEKTLHLLADFEEKLRLEQQRNDAIDVAGK